MLHFAVLIAFAAATAAYVLDKAGEAVREIRAMSDAPVYLEKNIEEVKF